MPKFKGDKYICYACGNEFESGWSDKEALEEKNRMWGDIPIEECGIICDLCFKKFKKWLKNHGGNA